MYINFCCLYKPAAEFRPMSWGSKHELYHVLFAIVRIAYYTVQLDIGNNRQKQIRAFDTR